MQSFENTTYSRFDRSLKKPQKIKKINVDLDSFHITINMDEKEDRFSREETAKSDESKTEFDVLESKNDSLSFAIIADEPAVKPISSSKKEKSKLSRILRINQIK